ncbi:mRNAion initiation factor TFIID subunit 3-like [Huso huso]|uniref:mRNAion initiation factor TFIID subunit 3-like n=1 Tax=Huso huso TaxID=61971 RepID=A0ABR0ZTI3_HUSHU
MCESYSRSLLRVSVAQICQALGWDSVQLTACDLLTDVLHRYIQQLARGCHRYSELYGRTDPMLDDVGPAFKLMGVNLSELEDYVHNLEPVGFAHQIPLFPVSKNNILQFPQPGTQDAEERKEYIPDYMPPIISSQEEEEEEQVPTDGGTSAEAMQVPLEEEEEMEEEEDVNDENFLGKRPLGSPDSMEMPVMKRSRYVGLKTESPEVGMEPREPLISINPQKVPPMHSPVNTHDSSGSLSISPEPPVLAPPSKTQQPTPKTDSKHGTPRAKPKITSPGQKTKSPKGSNLTSATGSPIRSPKSGPKEKKSPGRTKSPKSPKVSLHSTVKVDTPTRTPLAALSEKVGKENIHSKQGQATCESEKQTTDNQLKTFSVADNTIDDSIDAVIAWACAEREPDPFAFSSGSESEGEILTSPRRLTISEPTTPKLMLSTNSFSKGNSTPVPSSSDNSWTMDDSINEVIRKVNLGTPSSVPSNPPYLSSPSASPPTPEPLLKVYEEKTKLAASADVKRKLKKELKTKMKKKEKEKQKEKERDRDKEKSKEKNKEKTKEKDKDKDKESNKEAKLQWKDFIKEEDHEPIKFKLKDFEEVDTKAKTKESGSKKDKEKRKDKKKDKEKSKKDKEKKEKGKDKVKVEKLKIPSMPLLMSLKETSLPLFSTPTNVRISSMLPSLSSMLPEKLFEEKEKPKDREKKKEKKEKKKKKDKEKEKDKDKEKEKVKEKEKREEKKEKEKEKEKKEKEKEKHKHEKIKTEPSITALTPVIPRLTLRVGAGQDKIVISKVVSTPEAKTPVPKTPVPKTPVTVSRPKTPPPPPPPVLAQLHTATPPASALQPPPPPPPAAASLAAVPPPLPAVPAAGSSKTPVRSVVTETVSTYVIRDEWGNQIWICPGCNKADDGSPMIGCDGCDDWYHWPCVSITAAPPEEVQWYCPKCANKKKDKKHKKRKHKAH